MKPQGVSDLVQHGNGKSEKKCIVLNAFGNCLAAAWQLLGNCLESAWQLPGCFLAAAWQHLDCCLAAAWKLRGSCPAAYKIIF